MGEKELKSILFPGQGSQTVGMGKKIFDNFSSARQVFEEVDESLSQNLSKIIFEGPNEKLTMTENAQPAIMCVSMAMLRVLQIDFKINLKKCISFVAGHSLGEYTSLAATKSLKLSDVAKLLKIRGKNMQLAVSPGKGSMAAIVGGDLETVKEIITKSSNGLICQIANHNTHSQIVISGDNEAINRTINFAKEKGFKAIKLSVSAPFHCSYMKETAEKLLVFFKKLKFKIPEIKIVNNYSAKPFADIEDLKSKLYLQTFSTVRWYETILYMKESGVKNFYEIGHGKTLAGIIKRIDNDLKVKSLNSPTEFENLAKELL